MSETSHGSSGTALLHTPRQAELLTRNPSGYATRPVPLDINPDNHRYIKGGGS